MILNDNIRADIVTRVQDGRYYLFVPKYSLSADGDSWESAYQKLIDIKVILPSAASLSDQGPQAGMLNTGTMWSFGKALTIDIMRSFVKLVAVSLLVMETLVLLPHAMGGTWQDASRTLAIRLMPAAYEFWRLAGQLPPTAINEPNSPHSDTHYLPNQTLGFSRSGNGRPYLGLGWAEAEASGTWSVGVKSDLILPLAEPIPGGARLVLAASGFLSQSVPMARALVSVNGIHAGLLEFHSGTDPEWTIEIPPAALAGRKVVTVSFEPEQARSPASLRLSADARELGIMIRWFRLDTSTASQ